MEKRLFGASSFWRQLAFFSSLSTHKSSSPLRLPKLRQLSAHYAQFHSVEQIVDSIPEDREHTITLFLSVTSVH